MDIELLNNIYLVQEDNLMDKILTYCEQNEMNIQEIGDILSDSEQFKNTLWIDCVNNNTIKDPFLKDKQNSLHHIDEW